MGSRRAIRSESRCAPPFTAGQPGWASDQAATDGIEFSIQAATTLVEGGHMASRTTTARGSQTTHLSRVVQGEQFVPSAKARSKARQVATVVPMLKRSCMAGCSSDWEWHSI